MAANKKAKQYGDNDDENFFEKIKTLQKTSTTPGVWSGISDPKKPGKQAAVRSDTSTLAPKIGGGTPSTSSVMFGYNLPNTSGGTRAVGGSFGSPKVATRTRGGSFGDTTGKGSLLGELFKDVVGKASKSDFLKDLLGSLKQKNSPTVTSEPTPIPPAAFGKSFDDYLAEATGQTSVDNSIFSAREEALKSRAGLGEAEIAKTYAQLGNSMATAGSEANTRYAAAQESAGKNAEATTAAIAAARQGTSAEQAAIAANNGMTDIAPSASQNYAATDATNSISSALASSLSQRDYMQSMGAAQGNYFEGNRAASGFRGAEAQAALRRDLQGQLATVQEDRSKAVTNAKSEANSLAAQRYAADYGQFNDQRSYMDGLDDRAYSRAQQEAEAQQSYSTQMAELQANQDKVAAETAAAAEKNMPAYAKIQTQLAQAMPDMASDAMKIIAEAKMNGDTSADSILKKFQKAGMTPQQIKLAYQSANEYFNTYKY